MFDLMAAIMARQKSQAQPPADSADTAESLKPRGLPVADSQRKTADLLAHAGASATLRNNPQCPQSLYPSEIEGLPVFSANPQNPQSHDKKEQQNPSALLNSIAHSLGVCSESMRALMNEEDLEATRTGDNTREHLMAFFRQALVDGHLNEAQPYIRGMLDSGPTHIEQMKAWKPAHDRFISHLMSCPSCFAPRDHYCAAGAGLRQVYSEAFDSNNQLE